MDISLMVEGQNGLTWDLWSNILHRSEEAGLSGVFRSDHFFIGTQQDSLEPYLSFTMAALQTERIRFGPLVTPVTFRPPVNVGRMAAQLDQLSGGRFVMGLGGGWERVRARRLRRPLPARRRAPQPPGGGHPRHARAVGPRPRQLRRSLLHAAGRRLPAQAARGASDASHRRRRRKADHAHRRPVRPRVETASPCSRRPTPTRSKCCRHTATLSAATHRRSSAR